MKSHPMTPVDAAWFHIDGPANSAVIVSIAVTRRPLDFDRVRAVYTERLSAIERLRCRVVERSRGRRGVEHLVVEQSGEFRFLWLRQRLDVRLEITHEDRRIARARALSIDLGVVGERALDGFEASYTITDGDAGCVLGYRAVMVSRYPPPPGIGSVAVRQNLREQLAAIVAEIERRATED